MFCRNCGKELCEQAYVCPDCGCLVNNTKNTEKVVAYNEVDYKKILKILLLISFGCFCGAMMFAFFALTDIYYGIYSTYLLEEYVIPMFICSVVAFGTAVTAFVISLKKKEDETIKLLCIFNFMISIVMIGVGIFMLCFL